MSFRLRAVTPLAMSWAFVLVPLVLPTQRAAAHAMAGVISERQLGSALDSAHMAAVMAAAQRMRSPARFALSVQREVALSSQQVAALEVLVRAGSDSSGRGYSG